MHSAHIESLAERLETEGALDSHAVAFLLSHFPYAEPASTSAENALAALQAPCQ
jgi:hypothetical protein